MINKIVQGVIKYIDVLLFLLGTILFDVTLYQLNYYVGGIITAISLVIWGILTEVIFGKGGDN